MLGELESARVKGLSFVEFQVEVIKLVKHYIYQDYSKYPILKNFGVDEEEVELQVYQSLYNRKEVDMPSNMERYFIKASSLSEEGKLYGKDTKYMVCLVKRVVKTSFCQINRKLLRKGIQPDVSYDSISSDEFRDNFVGRCFGKPDDYDELHYRDLLKQVPMVKYPFVVLLNNKRYPLTSRLLLDLIVSGYGRNDLVGMIYSTETNENISLGLYAKIRSNLIKLAKERLKDYIYKSSFS